MSKLLEALRPKEEEKKVMIQARIPIKLHDYWKKVIDDNDSDWTKTIIAVLEDGQENLKSKRKTG